MLTNGENNTMLTKDLLRFRTRNGKVTPTLINPDQEDVVQLATNLCNRYENSIGFSTRELQAKVNREVDTNHKLFPAFRKLLDDRCTVAEDSGEVAQQRWQWILDAQKLRQSKQFEHFKEFQTVFEDRNSQKFDQLKNLIYSDLPDNRPIHRYKKIEDKLLPHRYNCAQIQGLIIHSKTITMTISKATISDKRRFFRLLKFHSLMGEIRNTEGKGTLEVELSGPLAIFQNAQTYGLRIANFFPHLLNFSKWSLRADINIKKRDLVLDISDKTGIKSHYSLQQPYIPEEFQSFVESFNEKAIKTPTPWTASLGDGFVNIGRQSYCFPDITLENVDGQKVYIELFHRWHRGELANRLKSLCLNPISNLIIGICKSLKKECESFDEIANLESHGIKCFWFRDFPTPKAVLTQLV